MGQKRGDILISIRIKPLDRGKCDCKWSICNGATKRVKIFVDKGVPTLVFGLIEFCKKGVSPHVGGRKTVFFLVVDKKTGGICLATLGS